MQKIAGEEETSSDEEKDSECEIADDDHIESDNNVTTKHRNQRTR